MKELIMTTLISIATIAAQSQANFKAGLNRLAFKSENEEMAGNLHLPDSYISGQRLPIVIVTGAWLTVKEQMPNLYARELAKAGYAAFTFDFRGFGESGGLPRQVESPSKKQKDIISAISYVQSLSLTDTTKIFGLGICFSAGYMLDAAIQDKRLKAVATVVGWLHNAEYNKEAFGGIEGISNKINAGREALKKYQENKTLITAPASSATEKNAAMFNVDYYLDKKRGVIKEWKNEFAVMSWEEYLSYDPISRAMWQTTPLLMIHSKQAGLPKAAQRYFSAASSKYPTEQVMVVVVASNFEAVGFRCRWL